MDKVEGSGGRMKKEIIKLGSRMTDPDMKSIRRIVLSINESQLWSVYIGLERLKLVPMLQKGVNRLTKEIYKIGVKKFNWVDM